ncbi:MAG: DUF2177 family protein [Pseudomonadota bacterium]
MKRLLISYLGAGLFMLAADMVWLSLMVEPVYRRFVGALLLEQPQAAPAIVFYVMYGVGVVVFSVLPGLQAGRWQASAARGALFGLLAYATYDLSNLATLRGWSLPLSLIDMAWGATLTAGAGVAGYLAARKWSTPSARGPGAGL